MWLSTPLYFFVTAYLLHKKKSMKHFYRWGVFVQVHSDTDNLILREVQYLVLVPELEVLPGSTTIQVQVLYRENCIPSFSYVATVRLIVQVPTTSFSYKNVE